MRLDLRFQQIQLCFSMLFLQNFLLPADIKEIQYIPVRKAEYKNKHQGDKDRTITHEIDTFIGRRTAMTNRSQYHTNLLDAQKTDKKNENRTQEEITSMFVFFIEERN